MSDETTFTVTDEAVTQLTAAIVTVEDGDDDWTFTDTLTATWHWYHPGDPNAERPKSGYWLISGDNTGSQQLVVWPYHIPALRALLERCAAESPAS